MTTPNHGAPDGAYQKGSAYGSNITSQTMKAVMGAAPIGRFVDAQNLHRTEVRDPTETAQQTANDAQSAVDELIAQQTQGATNGIGETYYFNGSDNAPLDTSVWTAFVGNTPSNLLCVKSPSVMGLNLNLVTGTNDEPWAIIDTPFSGDSQSISVVIGSSASNVASCGIMLRCDSGGTEGVYLNIYGNHLFLGWFSRSVGVWTPHDWEDLAIAITNGDRLELRVDGYDYDVLRNGHIIMQYTDSAHDVAPGATKRRSMVRQQTKLITQARYISFKFSSITIKDFAPAAVTGTAFRAYRSSTSNTASTTWTTTGTNLDTTTFDVLEYASPNIDVDDFEQGVIGLPKVGLWLIKASVYTAGLAQEEAWLGIRFADNRSDVDSTGFIYDRGCDGGNENLMYVGVINVTSPYSYIRLVGGMSTGSSGTALDGEVTGMATNFSGVWLGTL